MSITYAELSRHLGVSVNTIKSYEKLDVWHKGMTCEEARTSIVKWLVKQKSSYQAVAKKSLDSHSDEALERELLIQRVRKETLLADQLEIAVDIEKKTVVKVDVISEEISDKIFKFKSKMLTLSSKLSPRLTATSDYEDIKNIIDDAVQEALEELSNDQ